jgi:hypothetical protein
MTESGRCYVEVWGPGGATLIPLDDKDRISLGKDASNDVSLVDDTTVSHLHAVLERFAAGWSVRDLGSRNGTFVNGERVFAERRLQHGDELRLGRSRLMFRASELRPATVTDVGAEPPPLTARERDVLIALCKPLLSTDVFTEPASIRQIAAALSVSEAAVKQHLAHLYDKFEVHEPGERRRVRLANEAVQRGAVTVADLKDSID